MPDNDSQAIAPRPEEGGVENEALTRPVYRKPVLRKYDQIEQVKPYGPSEMEAS